MPFTINAVDQVVTPDYAIYQGDCCELIRGVPDASVHYGLHSPPFEGLYKFSASERDMSNSEGAPVLGALRLPNRRAAAR